MDASVTSRGAKWTMRQSHTVWKAVSDLTLAKVILKEAASGKR
jgi:hypothetical protein